MTLRSVLISLVLLPFVLLTAAIPQDSAPISLSGPGHPPLCRGKGSDAPECVTPPHATYSPDPEYPEVARRAHDQGFVVVDLVVDTNGLPHDAKIVRGVTPALDQAAIETVKRWKFTPASKDGHPLVVRIRVELSFYMR